MDEMRELIDKLQAASLAARCHAAGLTEVKPGSEQSEAAKNILLALQQADSLITDASTTLDDLEGA